MSYRVDIPTLSANEVYTLTFEYGGTETIQLVVGDLTLETTDRRVVFTTTSPVNYIESNVNLTNLNIYEGYYESDDFGGKYTQESYIEGKTLFNVKDKNSYYLTDNWYVLAEMTEDGYKRVTQKSNTNGICCFNSTGDNNNFAKTLTGEKYTVILHVRKNTFPSDLTFNFGMFYAVDGHYDKNKVDADLVEDEIGVKKIRGGQTGRAEVVMYNTTVQSTQQPTNFWGKIKSVKADDGTDCTNSFGERTDFYGCVLEYTVTVIEGDYYGQGIKPFSGIGCVKSPKILSQTKHRNIMLNTKPHSTTNLITVSDDNTYIYLAESARHMGLYFKFTQEYLSQYGISNGDKLCIELDGMLIEGTGTQAANTSTRIGIDSCAWSDGTSSGLNTAYKNLPENGHYCDYITINGNAGTIGISFLNNPDWSGTNKIYEIQNLRVYKIEDKSEMGTYDCCKITTPDDLELYSFTDVWDNKTIVDTLDLTTGIATKNVGILDITDINTLVYSGYDSTNDLYNVSCSFANFPNIVAKGNDTLASSNILEKKWYTLEGLFSHGIGGKFEIRISGTRGITSGDEAKQWVIDNLIIFYERTPEIIQLDINVLKSYYNGSIQTSSQQLAPTLKTTLPISNKFTTTNLTSGSTYNVYFDGTATKLDAGGTIITNPISPCEVECGGTTLTIEGTDIQNVRVLETTNKNEVGNNGTSDVELSKIITANSPSDSLISTKIEYWEQTTEYGNALRYVLPIQVQPNTKYILNTTNIQRLFAIWDVNGNVLVNQNIYVNSPYIWTTPVDCPSEVYLYLVYQTDVNRAHLDELRMFEGEIDFGYQGQQEPLISRTISDLEQPIKLRSLGTTYDSYNPVTGELTKRIGVSETDGSYSVLSSPIIENVPMGEQIANIVNKTPINNTASNVTFDGNAIKVSNGGYGIFLLPEMKPLTKYTIFVEYITNGRFIIVEGTNINGYPISNNGNQNAGTKLAINLTTRNVSEHILTLYSGTTLQIMIVEGTYSNYDDLPYFEGVGYKQVPPQLYTNGQVKVYSDSDVYPTTILNGQSTNNYEVNDLNTSSNYTIRYEGECESINLANKSNTQGTNRIVKSGTNGSGNLTFVNDSGDIDNVLLVQNDVREQEIKHFNGLETVEVSKLFVSNKQNLFEQYMKADYDYTTDLRWGTQQYGSLHNGVFKCGELVGGENLQMTWNLIRPHADVGHASKLKEGNPIVLANKVYNISFNISIVDHHTVNGNHSYAIRAYDFDGNEVSVRKATGGQAFLSTWSNGVTNPTPTKFINLDVIFSKDVYCFVLHADYGGAWKFDCTITDFTICEPENAKPDVPLIYEYIDLPQPVQLNSLLDGTHDTYNPITGEYVQNVGYLKASDATIGYRSNTTTHVFTIPNSTITNPPILTSGWATYLESSVLPRVYNETVFGITQSNLYWYLGMNIPKTMYPIKEDALQWVLDNVIILYKAKEPITTQLTPINIPTFEGGILQLITTDGKVFPMIEYSMPTNNRYDTSSWESGAVYTQRNMTEVYFNDSTTPMTPTETTTLTTDHISSGSIILNDNGNGLIVLKGNYTGRDIPYFTGMRSVEAIEVETTPSPDQPLFGKGGRK